MEVEHVISDEPLPHAGRPLRQVHHPLGQRALIERAPESPLLSQHGLRRQPLLLRVLEHVNGGLSAVLIVLLNHFLVVKDIHTSRFTLIDRHEFSFVYLNNCDVIHGSLLNDRPREVAIFYFRQLLLLLLLARVPARDRGEPLQPASEAA